MNSRSARTRCASAAEKGYPTATDLADWIVAKLKKPFRESPSRCREKAGRARRKKLGGRGWNKLALAELKKLEPKITKDRL